MSVASTSSSPWLPVANNSTCSSGRKITCECYCSQTGAALELQLNDAVEGAFLAPGDRSPETGSARGERRERGGRGGADGSAGGREGSACVLYHEDGAIATLTLNRPKVKNAFSSAVYFRLVELLERAEKRDYIVAVVLTGAGGYFTSGADIKELGAQAPPATPMLQQPFGVFATALLNFPKLVVAAVNGPAVGIGVTLLPHCDIVYACSGPIRPPAATAPATATTAAAAAIGSAGSGERRRLGKAAGKEAASFWTPFFRLAIVPEFCSSVTFPEILGWSLANEVLVMGRQLGAREALVAGLVSTLVSAETDEDFLRQVRDDLKRSVLGNVMAAESAKTFKRVMWCSRRPRLLRVLAEELVELDRRMQAGHPKAALKHLARRPPAGSSKL